VVITRAKAINLHSELAQTAKNSAYSHLTTLLRKTDGDIILSDESINDKDVIECYHFFNDVGMLGES
jgi:hypothetical protein